jgi:hypothetical protein
MKIATLGNDEESRTELIQSQHREYAVLSSVHISLMVEKVVLTGRVIL